MLAGMTQHETNQYNIQTCKSIAFNLEKIAIGVSYFCSECGEMIYPVYGNEEAYCHECNKTFDVDDLTRYTMKDYFECCSYWFRVSSELKYEGVEVQVCGGGPSVCVNTCTGLVELHWMSDRAVYAMSTPAIVEVNKYSDEVYRRKYEGRIL